MRLSSNPVRALGTVAAVLMGSAMLVAPSAGAQPAPITIDPAEPAPGSTYTVSGTCLLPTFDPDTGEETGIAPARLTVAVADTEPDFLEDLLYGEGAVRPPVASDGSWAAEFVMPDHVEPGHEMFFVLQCLNGTSFTQTGSFGVGLPIAPPVTTTTTTTTLPGDDDTSSGGGAGGGPTATATGGAGGTGAGDGTAAASDGAPADDGPGAAPPARAVNGEPSHTG